MEMCIYMFTWYIKDLFEIIHMAIKGRRSNYEQDSLEAQINLTVVV